jgi:hypothetical protein
MRPSCVVAHSPLLYHAPGVRQRKKPMLVEALVSQSAIETLDECILYGLSGPDELKVYAVRVRPGIEGLALKLRAVVENNPVRISADPSDPVEYLNHSISSHARVNFNRQRFPRAGLANAFA